LREYHPKLPDKKIVSIDRNENLLIITSEWKRSSRNNKSLLILFCVH
jgi:hypothetical protein